MSSGDSDPAAAPRPYFRAAPEDFVVEEIPLYPAAGEGEHTFVLVEKRLRNTEEVAKELARAAGGRARDVGYAGRKDRVAIARQWFSVPGLAPERALGLELEGIRVLDAQPHRHKLRTGQLRGNRFEIRVHGVDAPRLARAREAIDLLRQRGLPNRFGPQRFGRDGDNAERALAILAGREPVKDRRFARLLFSALQARVFNEVLASRPLPLWQLEAGDLAMKHDSGGVFQVEDVELENARAARFEISPTGLMFGTRMTEPAGVPGRREAEMLMKWGLPESGKLEPPRGIRLRGARRSLRIPLPSLEMEQSDGTLELRFQLPPGSYATVLLEEVFGPLDEGAPSGAAGPRESPE